MSAIDLLDAALDRSVVLGYTRVGSGLRRQWWPADPEPDALAGRAVLVTGATSGLGEAAAAGCARLGATVLVHGRDPDRLAASLERLRSEVPQGDFRSELCDLSDLGAVRAWGQDLAERHELLHGIVHNAGTMVHERRETPEGHELTLASMLLAPHLLTDLLRSPLAAAGDAVVVFMSSGGMYAADLRADDPEYREPGYSGPKAYARVKRMQVAIAELWAEELAADGVGVASMHPGWVDTRGVRTHLPRFRAVTRPLLRDEADGADTAVWLVATRPGVAATDGFWHDRRKRPTSYGRSKDDRAGAVRLWDYAAAATGTPVWR